RAAIARRIRSAIHRFEFDRNGLDTGWALAGCHCEWPLSRGEPGNGVAARRISRTDGKEFKSARGGTLAANGRPSPGNVRGDPSLRAAGPSWGVAATNSDERQSLGHRVRHLPGRQPAPSASAGANTTDATGALVLRGRDRTWRGTNARTDLSWALPGCRPRQGPQCGGRAHKRQ